MRLPVVFNARSVFTGSARTACDAGDDDKGKILAEADAPEPALQDELAPR
jgi:hypothetical protein